MSEQGTWVGHRCPKCQHVYPRTADYWYFKKSGRRAGQINGYCKTCQSRNAVDRIRLLQRQRDELCIERDLLSATMELVIERADAWATRCADPIVAGGLMRLVAPLRTRLNPPDEHGRFAGENGGEA